MDIQIVNNLIALVLFIVIIGLVSTVLIGRYLLEIAEEWYDKHQMNKLERLSHKLSIEKYKETLRHESELAKAHIIAEGIVTAINGIAATYGREIINIKKLENTTIYDHLKALDQIIETEFVNFIVLPRAGTPNKPMIEDVRSTTNEIASKVIGALTPEYFEIFKLHGLNEDYIMSYIVRELFGKIIKYSRDIRKKDE